ncbi:MAG: DUF1569 domain-containing protein [Candidatus Sulfotelmatobacter sp.]
MDPHLRRLQAEIELAVQGLSMEQLSWHPPGKWSVAEILEHLYLTYTGTSKGFSRLLDSGKASDKLPTFKQRMGRLVVVHLGYFPRGAKSPRVAVPRGVGSEKSLVDIGAKIAEMGEIMNRCEARFGPKTRILDHPMLGPFSVSQWRKFHLVHGLHHMKQIRRLRKQF